MSRRKAEMVLELIDRASRPARRFIRLQDRMGKSVQRANRMAKLAVNGARRATDLYTRATHGLSRAQDTLRRGIRRTNEMIARQKARLRSSAALIRSGIMGTGRAALLAGAMFAAYSGTAVLAANSFIGPARQFENFGVQLESIEGSAAKGQAAMAWIEDFATRTPLELHQVVESFQQMRTFGMDPVNGSMMALVDTMAASGKGAEQLGGLVLALGKSWTKGKLQGEEIMMLMERGVPVYELLGEKMGKNADQIAKMATAGKLGRNEIQLLIDAMGEKNAGASEKMSKTWDGIISNLMDNWTSFQRLVMSYGVFDWMKDKLRGVLDVINQMKESGELDVWAKQIADNIMIGLNALWLMGSGLVDLWQTILPLIIMAKDALGGWRNLALAVLAIPFRGVILGAAFALVQLAWGAGSAAVALAGIGFGSIGAMALRFGVVLLGLLNPLNWVRAAFVALRVALISTGIGAIVVGLAMAGTWVYNNWSGLQAFFTGFGQAFMAALGPAGPLVETVIGYVSSLWDWISKLVGPLDANAEQWAAWGQKAGEAIAAFVNYVAAMPGEIAAWLSGAWQTVTGFTSRMWNGLKENAAIAWDALKSVLLNYTPHGLIYTHWDGIAAYFSGVWAEVSTIFSTAWSRWGSDALAAVMTIVGHFLNLPLYLAGMANSLIEYFTGINLFDAGVAMIQTLWDGAASLVSAMVAAISAKLSAIMPEWMKDAWNWAQNGGEGTRSRVNEIAKRPAPTTGARGGPTYRASGGSFNPGWLVTGEKGPELEYKSRGGYIAHNRALNDMVVMSTKIANANTAPKRSGWFKGAAVSAGIAATMASVPAAAEPPVPEANVSDAAIGAKYLRSDGGSSVSISAPMSVTITGSVTPDAMADLDARFAEHKQQIEDMLEEAKRLEKRRGHG